MFVLMEKDPFSNDFLAVYGPASCSTETIGVTGEGQNRGHFSHDLACVGKFETKEEAFAYLAGMSDFEREYFRSGNWRIVPYEKFEEQVLKVYLKRPLKERGNLALFLNN